MRGLQYTLAHRTYDGNGISSLCSSCLGVQRVRSKDLDTDSLVLPPCPVEKIASSQSDSPVHLASYKEGPQSSTVILDQVPYRSVLLTTSANQPSQTRGARAAPFSHLTISTGRRGTHVSLSLSLVRSIRDGQFSRLTSVAVRIHHTGLI